MGRARDVTGAFCALRLSALATLPFLYFFFSKMVKMRSVAWVWEGGYGAALGGRVRAAGKWEEN